MNVASPTEFSSQATENQLPKTGTWPVLVDKMAANAELKSHEYWNTVKSLCGLADSKNEIVIAFLMMANKYHLDPMARQIYAFERKGKVFPIVPVDGWLKIINEHPEFDGMKFKDEFDDAGKIVSITCMLYRKDRKYPVIVTEYYDECFMKTDPWEKWPIRMLRHKATIQAARYAFGLAGIYDPDEGDRIQASERQQEAKEALQGLANHMSEVTETSSQSVVQDAAFTETSNADSEALQPSDWDAVYDELAPGITNAKTPLELKILLEENAEQIDRMGVHAPRRLIEKWLKMVQDKQATFPKRGAA